MPAFAGIILVRALQTLGGLIKITLKNGIDKYLCASAGV